MSWESLFSANLDRDDAAAWGEMASELRELHDAIASMRFDRSMVDALTADVRSWRDRLAPLGGEELEQANGRVGQVPVRGHAMLPEVIIRSAGGGRVDGAVTFGRWFMGGGMAVHGGAVALLFDEALGILAAVATKAITRTAYLRTDFRALTPIDVELDVSAWVDRVEGRKVYVKGELRHGDVVCAEADALFLQLLPEQGLGQRTTSS
ncbi:MAG: PaaI family thioesterase [Aeromicrobium sp.]|uniref:PaaI family thioesterase n=1 Tax=Aeromicrobium sp. TaxID=1871063 RepID=UPI003C58327B